MIRHFAATVLLALSTSTALAADLPQAVSLRPDAGAGEVQEALRAVGFTDLSDAKHSGNVFRALAVFDGEAVHVVVDTATGRILDAGQAVAIELTPTTSDQQVADQLAQLGYANLGEIQHRGGIIAVTGEKGGQPVNVFVTVENGRLSDDLTSDVDYVNVRSDLDTGYLTQELQRLGYNDVGEIRQSGNIYRVTASKDGRAIDLRIDGRTGAVGQR